MAYHSASNIQEELALPFVFSADTTPTATRIATIIEETDADIDSKLSGKYVVAITGTKALIVIRRISTLISAGRVERIQGMGYEREADSEIKQQVPARLASGMRKLNDLVIGKTSLVFETVAESATLKRANQKVVSSFDDGIQSSKTVDFGDRLEKDKF